MLIQALRQHVSQDDLQAIRSAKTLVENDRTSTPRLKVRGLNTMGMALFHYEGGNLTLKLEVYGIKFEGNEFNLTNCALRGDDLDQFLAPLDSEVSPKPRPGYHAITLINNPAYGKAHLYSLPSSKDGKAMLYVEWENSPTPPNNPYYVGADVLRLMLDFFQMAKAFNPFAVGNNGTLELRGFEGQRATLNPLDLGQPSGVKMFEATVSVGNFKIAIPIINDAAVTGVINILKIALDTITD